MARIPAGDSGNLGPNEDLLRSAADDLNLDYDRLTDDELEFVGMYASGSLAASEHPESPLIPSDPDDATPDTSTPDDGAPVADVDDADVRIGDQASDDGGVPAPAPADGDTSAQPPPVVEAVPHVDMVDLGGGVQMPRDQVLQLLQAAQSQPQITPEEANILALRRQGLIDYTYVDPTTGQVIVPTNQPAPSAPPAYGQSPAPVDEWIDPAAQSAFAQQQAQLADLAASQRQLLERTVVADQAAIESAIEDSSTAFAATHTLEPTEINHVMETLRVSGILPAYRDRYPNDPRTAMTAALEAVYWNMPEYRQREIDKAIAANTAVNADVSEKKAANAGIASSAGSVARTSPISPSSRADQDKAITALIEADPLYQSRNGS